jgi:hypothetical protein
VFLCGKEEKKNNAQQEEQSINAQSLQLKQKNTPHNSFFVFSLLLDTLVQRKQVCAKLKEEEKNIRIK